ncbi:MAG TPA: YqaA family protein [Thermoanaerobaculia bacterium]|nr:YqaA family protein [Thermoanaerobaculia bacterium]
MTELAAYAGLFLWSFLAATILPLGSEPALVGVVRQYDQFMTPVLVATAGNYLGACTTWLIGRGVAGAVAHRRKLPRGYEQASTIFRRYGQPSLLLSWVPIIGDAIVAVAGAARVPFSPFSLWVIAGKLARYAVVAWLALSVAR